MPQPNAILTKNVTFPKEKYPRGSRVYVVAKTGRLWLCEFEDCTQTFLLDDDFVFIPVNKIAPRYKRLWRKLKKWMDLT